MTTENQKPVRFGIAFKIGLLATVLVVVMGLASWYEYSETTRTVLINHETSDLNDDANLAAQRFRSHISLLREDVLGLSQLPEVQALIALKPLPGESSAAFEKRRLPFCQAVAEKFKQLGESGQEWDTEKVGRWHYSQIRFISHHEAGRELVRAHSQENRDLSRHQLIFRDRPLSWKTAVSLERPVVNEQKLQTEYYRNHLLPPKTKALFPNRIYLSKIDLTRAFDPQKNRLVIQKPYRPVIRAFVPIFVTKKKKTLPNNNNDNNEKDNHEHKTSSQKLFGIIVIDLNVHSLIREQLDRFPHRLTYVIDEEKQFIWHPDPNQQYRRTLTDKPEKEIAAELEEALESDPIVQYKKWKARSELYNKTIPRNQQDAQKDLLERENMRSSGIRLRSPASLNQPCYLVDVTKHPGTELDRETNTKITRWLEKINRKYRPNLDQYPLTESAEKSPSQKTTFYNGTDPLYRGYNSFTDRSTKFRFRSGSQKVLDEILADMKQQDWATHFDDGRTIQCDKFASHALRLYLDPNDHQSRYLDIVIAGSIDEIVWEMESRDTHALQLFLTLAIGAMLLAFLFSRLLTRPLKRLEAATKGFGAGHFDVVLPLQSRDEFGVLARAFQEMIGQVREREEDVRQQEARMRAILNTAADGIMTVNEDGLIESFNQAAERIFGYSADELINQKFTKIYPEKEGATFYANLQSYLKTGHAKMIGQTTETIGRRKDGHQFPVELAMSEVLLGNRRIFTTILRDVTERKHSEIELTKLTKLLRDVTEKTWQPEKKLSPDLPLHERVKEHTAAARQVIQHLEEVRDKALAANRAKDTFLANMSHELRTPLTAIIGYSEYLEKQAAKNQQDNVVSDLQKIIAAGRHLTGVIDDVLDLAKIEVGEMKLHLMEFDVQEMLNDVISTTQFSAIKNENELQFVQQTDVGKMTADAKRVRQIIINLVGNACKFTTKGNVSLSVTAETVQGRDGLKFQVTDTGIGLTEEQIERIFKPFSQADSSTSRKYGGTGLGLAISRRFCTMMGGTITVNSKPDNGSTFTVWLPRIVEQQEIVEQPQQEMVVAENRKNTVTNNSEFKIAPTTTETTGDNHSQQPLILVIDDDPNICDLMQRQLGKTGFRVHTEMDPKAGLEAARSLSPDVITLDISMPKIDGWDVMTTLKKDPLTCNIPVIMVTMMDDRSRGFAMGAYDFLNKPVEWGQLVGTLESAMQPQKTSAALLIGNDSEHQKSDSHLLQEQGYSVSKISLELLNGKSEAKRPQEPPEFILFDVGETDNKSVMKNIERIKRFCQQKRWNEVSIIVVTNSNSWKRCSPKEQTGIQEITKNILMRDASDFQKTLLKSVLLSNEEI